MQQSSPHIEFAEIASSVVESAVSSSAVIAPAKARSAKKKSASSVFQVNPKTQSLLGIQILASGSYVPDRIVTNAELESRLGIEPGWVEQRTGILERRHVAEGQATSHMCIEAARRAMRAARVSADEIDLVVVGTFSPDYLCPSTACLVQNELGLSAPAFDLQAACSGFMYALATAAQFVATGNSKMALVIGGDANSRIVDQTDKRIAPLFGDGAGAVLLTAGEPHQGLMCYQLGSDGSGGGLLDRPSGGSLYPASPSDIVAGRHFLRMDGRSVFKWAVRVLTDTIELVLNQSGMSAHDVDLFLLHQANIRIINHAVEQLGIPQEKVLNNLSKYGNTSAASIPIALDEAFHAGRLNRGDTVLMSGFGAGLTWGTALFRW
ncbi:MAG: ketoacyl-ACP synthase III [Planctomycetes bacterium]|nr:ketoacyl-ACP synthase III [Planctomycetota bacterium]